MAFANHMRMRAKIRQTIKPYILMIALAGAVILMRPSIANDRLWQDLSYKLDQIDQSLSCREIARMAGDYGGLPTYLLEAIALAESGRTHLDTNQWDAWPWTITSNGRGRYYPDVRSAWGEVQRLILDKKTNIDIGCMQINYHYHAENFDNLADIFDPIHNIAYAASFLRQLYDAHGNWPDAIAHYHSSSLENQQAYLEKIMTIWFELDKKHSITPYSEASFTPPSTQNSPNPITIQTATDDQKMSVVSDTSSGLTDAYNQQKMRELRARRDALTPR